MKIINQRKISVLWHLICFSLVLAFTACSDDKEELQEYLTPASGSESIFEQGFSFGEAASSQSVSFEAGQQWTAELSGEDTGWCNITRHGLRLLRCQALASSREVLFLLKDFLVL